MLVHRVCTAAAATNCFPSRMWWKNPYHPTRPPKKHVSCWPILFTTCMDSTARDCDFSQCMGPAEGNAGSQNTHHTRLLAQLTNSSLFPCTRCTTLLFSWTGDGVIKFTLFLNTPYSTPPPFSIPSTDQIWHPSNSSIVCSTAWRSNNTATEALPVTIPSSGTLPMVSYGQYPNSLTQLIKCTFFLRRKNNITDCHVLLKSIGLIVSNIVH